MKALIWKEENLGADFEVIDIPDDLPSKAQELHTKLVDMAVEEDEKLLEPISTARADRGAAQGLHPQGHCAFRFVPVLCGAAFKNKGVQPLLDGVVDFLPSPLDKPPVEATKPRSDEKIQMKPGRQGAVRGPCVQDHGRSIRRLDHLRPHLFGALCRRARRCSTRARTSASASAHASDACEQREDIKEAYAGDIVAFAGLKNNTPAKRSATCRTSSSSRRWNSPIRSSRSRSSRSRRPTRRSSASRLHRLASGRPVVRVTTDQESGQTILKGMGELHLEIKVDILKRTYKVDANIGQPQVAYRETLSKPTTILYTHKKQTGGSGQFAEVKIIFEPLPPGSGFEFENDVVGGTVPKEFIPAVEKGLKIEKEGGLLIGFPVIDFKATLGRRQVSTKWTRTRSPSKSRRVQRSARSRTRARSSFSSRS
jgi:elongation factor G